MPAAPIDTDSYGATVGTKYGQFDIDIGGELVVIIGDHVNWQPHRTHIQADFFRSAPVTGAFALSCNAIVVNSTIELVSVECLV